MTTEKLEDLLQQGEGIEVEFKTSAFDLNKDIFDSICAFLNRRGGHLLLGVKDNGKVDGVIESCMPEMVNNLITTANNPAKLYPPLFCSPQVLDYEGKKIIYLYVPESTHVHSTSGKIFDRNGDCDLDITRQTWAVENVYMRKQSSNYVDRVFPYFELADCNKKLFKRIRQMACFRLDKHPWKKMSDIEIIRSAGLYSTDMVSGKSGMTLAAVLLLGKDEAIFSALSHYKTDALLRVENLDRYDDRDDIRTNLIDSYDRLMAFIAKHLPDKFYLEGTTSVSLRDRLFREVVSNLLIHRAFSNAFPAKLIIEKDRVYTENWTHARGWGLIDPKNFAPFPKNPTIAKFFKEIGKADELGSGVRNVFRYGPVYTQGALPELVEGDVFKTIIPLQRIQFPAIDPRIAWSDIKAGLGVKLGVKLGVNEWRILEILWQNPAFTVPELAANIKISTTAVENNIAKLKKKLLLERVGSDKNGHWKINA